MTRVAIIGLGLIGGSAARALVRAGFVATGTDTDRTTVMTARRDGILAEMADAEGTRRATSDAEAVVIAVPVRRVVRAAVDALDLIPTGTPLFHAASLQRAEALALPPGARELVIGTHPMAGSHETGYAASRASLFEGASVSIEARANQIQRARAESVWRAVGVTSFFYRAAEEHDALMSWISHLPQLVSTALAATLERARIDPRLAGPGARDTTRLAESPIELWEEILGVAPPDTIDALDQLQATLKSLRGSLEAGHNERGLDDIWEAGRRWKLAGRRP